MSRHAANHVVKALITGLVVLASKPAFAQRSSCPQPTVAYSPVTVQACQPVTPNPVVVQQERRCCLLRFCDWLWGRNTTTVVTAPPVAQAVSYAPCPAPACSTCPPTGCSDCPACGTSPCCCGAAPALSYRSSSSTSQIAVQSYPYSPRTVATNRSIGATPYTTPMYASPPRQLYSQPTYSTFQPSVRSQSLPRSNYVVPATYQAPVAVPRQNFRSGAAVQPKINNDRLTSIPPAQSQFAKVNVPAVSVATTPLQRIEARRVVAPQQRIGWSAGGP